MRVTNEERVTMKQILVVNDDPMTQWLLETVLVSAGYQILRAFDDYHAISILKDERPDMLLCEAAMPDGADDHKVLNFVRSTPRLVDMPVIMVSADADTQGEYESKFVRADNYLSNIFMPNTLVSMIDQYLGGRG